MENIIEIKNLKKKYKDVFAVNDISFNVKKGEFFSFLGVNGAGKSTTISIICGMLEKDSGSVLINGVDVDKSNFNDKIGVVFQNSILDKMLSVYDNLYTKALMYMTKDKAIKKIEELANILDFKNLYKRPLNKLSGGQLRKIDIARALLNDPEILILDEPTTGLDPQTRTNLWNVLLDLKEKRNMTIFLTTHYMEEAALSDYIVIINKGEIKAFGTPLELKNQYTIDYIKVYNPDMSKIPNVNYKLIKQGILIEVKNTLEAKELIINNPEFFIDFEVEKGKIDDVFLNVTKEVF